MASEPKLPPAAQAAAVRAMLTEDATLTPEGIETTHPNLSEGVRIVLTEKPKPAQSGAAPMEPMTVTDIL